MGLVPWKWGVPCLLSMVRKVGVSEGLVRGGELG